MKKIIPLFILTLVLSSSALFAQESCYRILSVDPATDFITIENRTDEIADLSMYRLCSLFSYTNAGIGANTTALFGDIASIPPNDFVIVQWPLNDVAADLALYEPTGSFSDPSAMVDFMQYGSAGNGRESEAATAGLWAAGTFVPGAGTMVFAGLCSDHSVENWFTGATGVDELDGVEVNIGPNPVQNQLTINSQLLESDGLQIRVLDVTGTIVESTSAARSNGATLIMDTGDWSVGVYFIHFITENGLVLTERIVKQK